MEYGIWSLHAAGGLWGDPRLARRHPILGPGVHGAPGAAFALNTLRPRRPVADEGAGMPVHRAMELVKRKSSDRGVKPEADEPSPEDNETNIETTNADREDEENSSQLVRIYKEIPLIPVPCLSILISWSLIDVSQMPVREPPNNYDDADRDESDAGSISSGNDQSRHSINNNLHAKPPDGLPCLLMDKVCTQYNYLHTYTYRKIEISRGLIILQCVEISM